MVGRKVDAMREVYGKSEHLCKECCHLLKIAHSKPHYKCKAYGISQSEATDWRAKWTGCGLFNAPIDGLIPVFDRLSEWRENDDGVIDGQIEMGDLL